MTVYEGIMQGLNEALQHAEGKLECRTTKLAKQDIMPVPEYRPDEIKEIRVALGMTQVLFAGFMGVSPKTVEAWEAGRNRPDGPARRILSMVQTDPKLPERYHIVTIG